MKKNIQSKRFWTKILYNTYVPSMDDQECQLCHLCSICTNQSLNCAQTKWLVPHPPDQHNQSWRRMLHGHWQDVQENDNLQHYLHQSNSDLEPKCQCIHQGRQ